MASLPLLSTPVGFPFSLLSSSPVYSKVLTLSCLQSWPPLRLPREGWAGSDPGPDSSTLYIAVINSSDTYLRYLFSKDASSTCHVQVPFYVFPVDCVRVGSGHPTAPVTPTPWYFSTQ